MSRPRFEPGAAGWEASVLSIVLCNPLYSHPLPPFPLILIKSFVSRFYFLRKKIKSHMFRYYPLRAIFSSFFLSFLFASLYCDSCRDFVTHKPVFFLPWWNDQPCRPAWWQFWDVPCRWYQQKNQKCTLLIIGIWQGGWQLMDGESIFFAEMAWHLAYVKVWKWKEYMGKSPG